MSVPSASRVEAGRARVLIAGIGNIFLGDDGFGCEVAQRLARRMSFEGVRIEDFGIRGLDLAYTLLDDYEAVIFVDAMPRGGTPGTLYVLEPELDAPAAGPLQTHNVGPQQVLEMVAALGGRVRRLVIVGCEPMPDFEETMEMSPPVHAALAEAVDLVEDLANRMLDRLKCGM